MPLTGSLTVAGTAEHPDILKDEKTTFRVWDDVVKLSNGLTGVVSLAKPHVFHI